VAIERLLWVDDPEDERVDGGGYPQGLSGEEIPVGARILAVADAYEAMTADRPYRRALGAAAAREQLRSGAGTQFDTAVVGAFLRVLERSEPSFQALLPAASVNAPKSARPKPAQSSRRPSRSASAAAGSNPSATASGSSR